MKILRDMALFVAVAELRSFSLAAKRLDIPTSSFSRRVAEMERELGVRLLNRNTRKVSLTEEGKAYFRRCELVLGAARDAHESIRSMMAGEEGHIRISIPGSLGAYRIFTQVPEFQRRYPKITLEFDCGTRSADLVSESYDLAFLSGALSDSSLIARRLLDLRRTVCISPDLLRTFQQADHPRELQDLPCVGLACEERQPIHFRSEAGQMTTQLAMRPAVIAHDEYGVLEMTLCGAGFAILDEEIARPHLASGRLVPIVVNWVPAQIPLYAVTASKVIPRRLAVFLDFIFATLSDSATRLGSQATPITPSPSTLRYRGPLAGHQPAQRALP
jgi:DNA-binding transcriptional LysR family regulator